MKRVILLRSNPVNPDPPVEKATLALLKAGYEVKIIGWDRSENYGVKSELVELSGFTAEIIRFGIKGVFSGGIKKNLLPLILFQKRLRSWLIRNKDKYDIIHAFDFDTGFIASHYAKKFKKKFVYHILDYYADSHGLRGGFLEKHVVKAENAVINFADATIICTEKRKEQIVGSTPKRLIVIHNTPSAAQQKPCDIKIQQTDRIKIVYVGILQGGRLLREIAETVSENSDLELHVGGFGALEEHFTAMSEKYDNIYYYGKLTYDKTLALESACDVMLAIYDPVVRNHRYAAPNKFYESLMLGKPVIMIRGTGMSQIIEDNDVGAVTDYSKDGFVRGIRTLSERKSEWPAMSLRMRELYKNRFSWEEMERRLVKLYTDLQNEENTDCKQ